MALITPYAKLHETLNGPGDQRPTALQIIKEYGLERKWAGRVVVVTGVSPGGLGVEVARAIHNAGPDVVITVRDLSKGDEVSKDILSDGKPGKVDVLTLDLSSLADVRRAAAEFLGKYNKLNVLINNAAVMACPKGKTQDGFETQLGTNFVGHLLLFQLLRPTLLASSTPEFNSRVVSVSSNSHRGGKIQFEDFNFDNVTYERLAAYGQSKLANILFVNELDRRYGSKGLHALSTNPGGIKTLQQHSPAIQALLDSEQAQPVLKSIEQGAATLVWAAVATEWEGKGGRYLEDCGVAGPMAESNPYVGHTPLAYDLPAERKLWVQALRWVGLEDDA